MGIGLQIYDANGLPHFDGSFPLNAHIGLGCSLAVNTNSSVYRRKFTKAVYLSTYHYEVSPLSKSAAFQGLYVSDHPKGFVLKSQDYDPAYSLFAFVNDGSPSANSLKTAIETNSLSNLPAILLIQHDPTYLYGVN